MLGLALSLLSAGGGCAADVNLLGGRQKCWSESEPRVAALMRGTLTLDPVLSTLATPEGDSLPLSFADWAVRPAASGQTVAVYRNGATVATNGEDVTIFGGMGSDGVMLVCAIEERHGS